MNDAIELHRAGWRQHAVSKVFALRMDTSGNYQIYDFMIH